MTSIQGVHPEWFGNHPWILPVSLLILFTGLIFWLTQIGWIQKLLGLRHPLKEQTEGNTLEISVPPVIQPPSKLIISSAEKTPSAANKNGCYKGGPQIRVERREDDFLVLPVDPLIQNFPYLQLKALHLANRLLELPKLAGPRRVPKYTEAEIRMMPEQTRLALLRSNDKNYIEACEFHFGEVTQDLRGLVENVDTLTKKLATRTRIVLPWQEKLRTLYESEIEEDLEQFIGNLSRAGFRDHGLDSQLNTWVPEDQINKLATSLWELALKIGMKEFANEKD